MRTRFLLPSLILLALAACGDSAIFLAPVEEPAQIQILTIADGEVLAPGSEVPLSISRDAVFTGDPETADQLLVELLDTDGVLLGEQIYESVDQATALPALSLPPIGDGLYVLRASYLDGDEVIQTHELRFFIYSDELELLGLSSFPASLYPDSAGLLSLSLAVSRDADPYLRWYLDDELVSSGFLSETDATLEIRAPSESGVYAVRVDAYPFAPDGLDALPASISYQTQLLVSTDQALDSTSLSPEESYFALFHFLGGLNDSGARVPLFDWSPDLARSTGNPRLAVEEDIFGYRLDGESGFLIDGFVLPVRDGRVTPFSLSMRLRLEVLPRNGSLVEVESDLGPVLGLSADDEGAVTLDLFDGQLQLGTGQPVLEAGRTSHLTVTVAPSDQATVVQIYVDGQTVISEELDLDLGRFELPDPIRVAEDGWAQLPGSAVIGGPGGFVGIIDELGIFFRDEGNMPSADTAIFLTAMEYEHGEKLVYAEGFEAAEVPETIEVEGENRLENGELVLEAGASALFPVFAFESEELHATVTLAGLPGSLVEFFAGELLVGQFSPGELELGTTELTFVFGHDDPLLNVEGPSEPAVAVDLSEQGAFEGLRMLVTQTGDDPARVAVRSVVAWREYPRIPAAILEPDGAE